MAPARAFVVAAQEVEHVTFGAVLLQREEDRGAPSSQIHADHVAGGGQREGVSASDGRDGADGEEVSERKHGNPLWKSAAATNVRI